MDNLVNSIKWWIEEKKNIRINKKLCKRFPFLIPWNRFSGKLITDCDECEEGYCPGDPEKYQKYNYEYTELDDMPKGWRKAFGIQMCEDIRSALIDDDDLDRWRIVQLKEKYGELRLYDNGHKCDSLVPFIIGKYEAKSRYTCICCGERATRMTTGWIMPLCDKCCAKEKSVPISEYYEEMEKDEQ